MHLTTFIAARLVLPVLGMSLGACTAAGSSQVSTDQPHPGFERYDVVTGIGERQTILTGFLLDGAVVELAVVTIDENDDRGVVVFAFDAGNWVPRLETSLRPQVRFVDVANIGGLDRLITYEPGRLSWLDFESGSERPLVAVTSSFDPPRADEIPHVDITRDLNDDGRDDLVVPDIDGFWVFVQTAAGAFADPVKIGPRAEMGRIYGADGYRYDVWGESRIQKIDYDRDGRDDLVFWNGDRFDVHLQGVDGTFAAVAETFTTSVSFEADDPSFLETGDMAGRVLHSLTDLNDDGVADLVVFSLEGTDIAAKRSRYEVHFGTPAADGGTAFGPRVDAAFPSQGGIQLGMEEHDLDGDGRVELMFTTIELRFLEGSLWKRIKGAMGDDVWLDLGFYRMEDGRYAAAPDATRRIALDGVPSPSEPGWVPLQLVLRGAKHESRRTRDSWPRAFNTTLRIGDVTGDGRADLLIGDHPRILDLFVGVPGPGLFAQRPRELRVDPPNDEEYTWLVDLDRDGTQDIFMHRPFTRRDAHGAPLQAPGTEPHQVTILIAR